MPKRTVKNRKSLRRKSVCKRRKSRGGGWSDGPDMVNPGNLVHHQYSGPGKDCTGNPYSYRPGYIFGYNAKGLPGLSGGRSKARRNRKSRGGASMPPAATEGPITNPNLPPVSGSLTPKPGDFPNTTGTAGTVANPDPTPKVVMSMPGVPTPPGAAQMPVVPIAELSKSADASNLAAPQKGGKRRKTTRTRSRRGLAFVGGRYGFFPDMGPLNPVNGVGVSPAPFGRIPCEVGTYNPLNPDPNGIQTMSTAPLTPPYVTGRMGGGASIPAGTTYAASAANFPTVQVGQADSMRYYAPTAGYRNDFMTFQAPSPVPGLTIQTPYDAKAFNQACIKTGGGSRKNKGRKGGAFPVAFDAGKFTPVTMDEIWTRKDFDGSNGLLPVKFGGKRRSLKIHRASRRNRHNRN